MPPICHLNGRRVSVQEWAAATAHTRSRSGVLSALLADIATEMENDPTCSGRDLMLVANLLETLERSAA